MRIPNTIPSLYLQYRIATSLTLPNTPLLTLPLSSNATQPLDLLLPSQPPNKPNPSNTSLTKPQIPMGDFRVPNSNIQLAFSHPVPWHNLDRNHMRELILLAGKDVQCSIDSNPTVGPDTVFTNLDGGRQEFYCDVGDGIDLFVLSGGKWNGGGYFTWGQLRDVLEGLRRFLVEGNRFYECYFMFWDGPPGLRRPEQRWLGEGRVRRKK